ncbi:hypothetical protein [Nocardia miyunensis]|uniref:hypothetical protein n=1 Tax=Nocardia miyunensis TaxID=282684 RepID=UPI00082E6CE8|nr:hypothetical protein [Nocardia miyunensis]
MNSPATPEDLDMLVVRAAVLHELHREVDAEKSRVKAELSLAMSRGSKLTGHDPRTGRSLGSVSKSDPDPIARVNDPEVFEQWVREQYTARLEKQLVFGPPEEVAAVLLEHAPHLVHEETVIPDHVRTSALAAALKEVVPGTKRETPGATLSVSTTKTKAAVREVVRELLASAPFELLALEAKA